MSPTLKAQLLRPPVIIGTTIVVAVVAVVVAYIYTTPKTNASYVHPTQGSITEEVDTPGTVKAAQDVDLSFQLSGRVSYLAATVGSHVAPGTTLASTDASDLQAAVEQAQAALRVQQAKLDALNAGARPEDIAVAQTAVSGAQNSLDQATQNLISAAQNSYVVSDDAVHNRADQFFNNPRTSFPTPVFSLSDSQLQNSIQNDRVAMEALLTSWQNSVSAFPDAPTNDQVTSVILLSKTNLAKVQSYLDEVASGLTKVIPTTAYPQSTIAGFQSSVAVARTNISSAIATLNVGQTSYASAQNSLATAQSNLTLAQAPATAQDLEQQQAQIAAAQANIDAAQAQLSKASIRAPFSGTITVNNAHLGQTATPGAPLISMVSDAQFQFETYVSEADFAKIKVGDTAQVALDAYQNAAPLAAHVVAVDPAATVQNGISSYKVTLQFDAADQSIAAGLTGNVRIITQTKENALQVPSSAIVRQGTGTFVLRSDNSGETLVPVQTGIASANGMTEIVSGISSTDNIRSFGTQQ